MANDSHSNQSRSKDKKVYIHTIYRTGKQAGFDGHEVGYEGLQGDRVDDSLGAEQNDEGGQPYAISYTFQQLLNIKIDPTHKMVLFYNLACCY